MRPDTGPVGMKTKNPGVGNETNRRNHAMRKDKENTLMSITSEYRSRETDIEHMFLFSYYYFIKLQM